MAKEPTYEELEQKVKGLNKKAGTSVPSEFRVQENVFHAIGQPALILNAKHEILAANSATLNVTGRPEKDLVGRKCYQFFHNVDQPPENCPLKKMLISGQVETAEMEVQVFDRSFLVSCTPVFGESGKISKIIHIATDITERKQAEEALREREATLRSIFRAAPTGIGMVCDRVIRQANERLCEMTGYSQAELLGQNTRMLYPSDKDFEYVGREKFAQIRKQGTGAVETRWQRQDGTIIDVFLSSTAIDPDDWSAGITFTALDITERMQAEEALKQARYDLESRVQERTTELEQLNALLVQEIEKHKRTEKALLKSEAKYRNLFNNAQVGLLRSRLKDGKIVECNNKFAQIAGFETPKECCADFIASKHYIDPGDRERALEIIKQTGKIENYETRGLRRDGSKGWVRYTGVFNREEGIFEGVIVDITKEKRAEAALRESEALYRSLFAETRAVMLLIDPESGNIVDANPAACSFYGYSKKEIARKKIFDFNTLPKKQVLNVIEKVIAETQRHFTFRHRLANGDVRDVEVYTNTIQIKGKPLLFSIIHDITNRKQAEKALQESEMRFSKLSEATWEAIVIHDRGFLLHANDQYYQMLGYEPADLLGKQTIPMTATPESVKIIRNQIDSGSLGPYEVISMRKDGTQFPVEIRSKIMEYSGKKVRVAAVRDITERKQAEAALRESEERFRSLVEQAADAIMAHDLDGHIMFVNEQAVQNLGYSKEELLSMNLTEICPKIIKENHIDKYWKKVAPNKPIMVETDTRRKDGSLFPAEVHLVQITLKGKKIILGFGRDITVRKQAEKELRKREAELKIQSQHLQEVNSALKVLLQHREKDKKELQENIIANVKELVLPYLDKLEKSKLDNKQASYIKVAQTNLNDIISPFLGSLPSKYLKLTPMEIRVANLIKHGKTTKEIAELLILSVETIRFHRKNIRKKFAISNKKANLRTYLLSAQ